MYLPVTRRHQGAAGERSSVSIRPLALAVHMLALGVAMPSLALAAETAEHAGDGVTLAPLSITDTASRERNAVTEDTQSYTTEAARTATPLSMSLRETPQSVSVVTQQRMQDQDMQTITDVVNNTVGVSMNRYETSRGQINARGFKLNALMIDGVSTLWEQPWSSGEIFSSLAMYDRVEVVRGANGLMTGAGDPSASLNMVRKRASSRELVGSVELSAGTWDTYGTLGDLSLALNEAGTVRARLVGEYNEGDSWIDLHSNERQAFYGTLDIDLTPDTTLWFGASNQENKSDSPSWGGLPLWYSDGRGTHWSRSKTLSADWSKWDTRYETYFINLEHTFANDWHAKAGYTRGKREADSYLVYPYGFPNPVTGALELPGPMAPFAGFNAGSYKTETTQDDYSFQVGGPVELFGRSHDVAIGYSHSEQDFDADTRGYIPLGNYDFTHYQGAIPEPHWQPLRDSDASETTQEGMYVATRLNLADDLKVILGARNSNYEKKQGASRIDVDNEVTPYAGIVYDLTENLSAYASYTEIFLPQSVRDANKKMLDPIVGESYETGLKAEFLDGRLNASAALFQIKQDNLGKSTGALIDPTDASLGYAYEATEGATSKGFELEVSGELAPGWNLSAGYTQFDVEDADGNAVNTLYPTQLLRTFTTYRLPGIFNDKLTIGGGVNWQESIHTYASNPAGNREKIQQEAYALVNLMARYEITENLSAQLNADNVTDKKYFDVFDAYGALTYGAPRSFTASAKYRF